jgi:hypothetical protein
MDPKCASLLRQLPQVDDLVRHPELAPVRRGRGPGGGSCRAALQPRLSLSATRLGVGQACR